MPIITLTDLFTNLFTGPGDLFAADAGVTIGAHSATVFSYTFQSGTTFSGYTVKANGTGFQYDGSTPVDGTMKSLTITDGGGQTVMTVTGIAAGSLASDLGLFASYEFGGTDLTGTPTGSHPISAWSQLLSGNDTINGSPGFWARDFVGIDAGNDLYNLGPDGGWIAGGPGNDTITGSGGGGTLSYAPSPFNAGIPLVRGITVDAAAGTVLDPYGSYTDHFSGLDLIIGTNARDTFTIGSTYLEFAGLRGADTIVGGGAGGETADYNFDAQYGGQKGIVVNLQVSTSGTDIMGTIRDGFGTLDRTVNIVAVVGTRYNDTFNGSDRSDYFSGQAGTDSYDGGAGLDKVDFRDFIGLGQHGISVDLTRVSGQVIDDGFGNSETAISIEGIIGSAFNDLIIGTTGDNFFRGHEGDDTMTGGGGHDTFFWNHFSEIGGQDVVQGFSAAAGAEQDILRFNVTGWGGTTTLHLVNGTAATEAADTFLFNPTTHQLSWDPDGTGAQAAIAIATLTGVAGLFAANFDLY